MQETNESAILPKGAIPLQKGPFTYNLAAEYFEGQIDTKAFRAKYPQYAVLSANPLVIEPEKGSYVYIAKFGVAVFWNCPEPLAANLVEEIGALPEAGDHIPAVRDVLHVHVQGEEDRLDFSEVWIRELNLDKLKIISLALAQSVALDYFEGSVKRAMSRFSPVMRDLGRYGKLLLKRRETLKSIGFAMEVRAAVLDSLTLFDPPPETWESESLAHLDSALFDQFNLEERHDAIEKKLDYISDAGARVMDVLTTRKSHQLEWIVIVLITLEVLVFALKELPDFFH
jgi:uncharacterized Rmd1/YagE family protein